MSYAIFDLDLEAPAATVIRLQVGSEPRWIVRCEQCGRRTPPRPRLSAAVRDQHHHGREHYRAMLNRAVSTGQVVPVHRLTDPSRKFRLPMPLDDVHLKEPHRKAS